MQLRDIEVAVLSRLRDGEAQSKIARELGISAADVLTITKHLVVMWRRELQETVRLAGYMNYLRMEMLWNMVIESLKVEMDPKVVAVAVTLLDKQNRMLGIGGSDSAWVTKPPGGGIKDLEREALNAGLELPKLFAPRTSNVVTA